MTKVNLKCKFCGKGIVFDTSEKLFTCTHCGQSFMISEFLSESDLKNIDSMQPLEIEKKILVSNLIIDGEQCLYKADFKAAETNFKKAIELDNKDSRAFYGVVKAMTHNFNVLPEGNDYKLFIKRAMELADNEQKKQISIQLEKLEVLQKEALTKAAKPVKQTKLGKVKSAFVSKLPYIVVFALTAFLLVTLILSMLPKPDEADQNNSTIEIYSAADLSRLQNNSSILNSTIVLMNDIDFENNLWSPIGKSNSQFTGKFYGNNHKISNLKINASGTAGFFGYCNNAIILSVKFDNVKITADGNLAQNSLGIVAGNITNTSIKLVEALPNCSINISSTNCSDLSVGGLVGYLNDSSIANSCSNISIDIITPQPAIEKLCLYVGGAVGVLNNSQIDYCVSSSAINISAESSGGGNMYVAGLAGMSKESSNKTYGINNSCFIGMVCITSQLETVVSGISYIDDTLNTRSNLVLQGSDTFKVNNIELENSIISDAELGDSYIQFFSNKDEFMAQLNGLLDKNFWSNTNSSIPHLK